MRRRSARNIRRLVALTKDTDKSGRAKYRSIQESQYVHIRADKTHLILCPVSWHTFLSHRSSSNVTSKKPSQDEIEYICTWFCFIFFELRASKLQLSLSIKPRVFPDAKAGVAQKQSAQKNTHSNSDMRSMSWSAGGGRCSNIIERWAVAVTKIVI